MFGKVFCFLMIVHMGVAASFDLDLSDSPTYHPLGSISISASQAAISSQKAPEASSTNRQLHTHALSLSFIQPAAAETDAVKVSSEEVAPPPSKTIIVAKASLTSALGYSSNPAQIANSKTAASKKLPHKQAEYFAGTGVGEADFILPEKLDAFVIKGGIDTTTFGDAFRGLDKDLFDVAAGYSHRFSECTDKFGTAANVPNRIDVAVGVDEKYILTGGRKFLNETAFNPGVTWQEAHKFATKVEYLLVSDDFLFHIPNASARTDPSNLGNTAKITEIIDILNDKHDRTKISFQTQLNYTHSWVDADGADRSKQDNVLGIGVAFSIPYTLQLQTGAQEDGTKFKVEAGYSHDLADYENPNSASALGRARYDRIDAANIVLSTSLPRHWIKIMPTDAGRNVKFFLRGDLYSRASNITTFSTHENKILGGMSFEF